MIDSELPTALRRPCTPSRGAASAVLAHPLTKWARSGPRRSPTNSHPTKSPISRGPRVWGTWPPNLSPPIGINHLEIQCVDVGVTLTVGHLVARLEEVLCCGVLYRRQHGDAAHVQRVGLESQPCQQVLD